MLTIAYEPNAIFLCPISTFDITSNIFGGLKVSDTPSLDGILPMDSTTHYISDIVIIPVYLFSSTEW